MSDKSVLSEIVFQLDPLDNWENEFLDKDHFPVVLPPKEQQKFQGNNIVTVSNNINGETVTSANHYNPNNNISRPRNKFILARNILSKVVKNSDDVSTDDISRIISKLWSKNQNGYLQFYFNYVSFLERCWHETYYPTYHYCTKKLVPDEAMKTAASAKGQNISVDVILDGPHPNNHFTQAIPYIPVYTNNQQKFPTIINSMGYVQSPKVTSQSSPASMQVNFELTNDSSVYTTVNKQSRGAFNGKTSSNRFINDLETLKNGAEDIEDVTKYLNLCSSTYGDSQIEKLAKKRPFPENPSKYQMNYKDFTMRFSLNKNPSLKCRSSKPQTKHRQIEPPTNKKGRVGNFPVSVDIAKTPDLTSPDGYSSFVQPQTLDQPQQAMINPHIGIGKQLPRGNVNNFNFEIIKSPFNFGKIAAVEDIINHS
ncbi:hypothetical protein WICPIJ_004990 [Wickerhamomyces pijperi]|uniref:HMG box domain-containing protein n=1 Tax=Wickerhamomyces pijperi TaxID=599730 RepID=A0A9P8TLI5_WICPI|nr:hypothetical protein WICPIJ_004990 [Wickerhamomyces pijperi]